MELQIKLGTLNLCQGLQSKKNLVKQTIIHEEIDLLFMQETEIKFNLNHELLSFPGYTIETEKNSMNSRVAVYIKNNIKYLRRKELEGNDCN